MKKFYPRLRQFVPGFCISKLTLRTAGSLLLSLLLNLSVSAADRYAVASNNWNSITTWSASSGGSSGASVPGSSDNVFIEGGRTVTIGATAAAANVNIELGSTLVSGNFALTVSGDFSNYGTFTAGGGTVNVGGNWVNTGIFNANTGTVTFTKTSSTQTLNAGGSSFYNLTHNAAGILQLITSDLSVTNNLSNSSGTFDANGRNVTSSFSFAVSGGSFSGGSGNLSVAAISLSNGTFTAPSGTFTVSGNWSRTGGTFTPGTNTVTLNGTVSQSISGSSATSFYNLTVSNGNDVNLTSATATVNNILNFSAGKINTGANVFILAAASNIIGAGSGKYVNGNLRMGIATGPTVKSFEVGDGSIYAPVQINFDNVTTAGTLTVFTTAGDHPQIGSSEINPVKSVNRVWNLANATTAFTNYNATFNFDPSETDAGSNTNIFSVNNFISGNSWRFPAIGTKTATSTQAIGLTTFGQFQVGEAAAETPCSFSSNTNSGVALSPCITDLPNNSQGLTINSFAAGQYFTLDVIKGINYRIYTANGTNPSDPLMLSIYDENAPANPALAVSFSNIGNTFTQPNNVYYLFTASISGKVRILINKKRDCSATAPGSLTVKVDTYGGGNTLDDQMAAGTDSWVAHIYDGITNVPFTGSFNNYLGYNTQPETFTELFGGLNNDANCLNIIYSGGNLNGTKLRSDYFSVRYRMNSTKKGLYIADVRSDDGSRLAVDGTLIYNYKPDWTAGQGPTTAARILMQLNGSSNLQLDYNEKSGGEEVSFTNFIKVIGNDLTTGLIQANCQGNDAVEISGDNLPAVLPGGLFREGNTTGYKWYYSLTAGGTRILLPLDTLAAFTPNTSIAPFNVPGTYYIYRQVSLRSTNNVNATASPFVETIVSNPAILTVTASAPLQVVTTTSSTFCYGNSATVNLASSDLGVNYQVRNNSNNAPLSAIVAGTGGPLNFSTDPLYATTTVNVTAINTVNGCTVKMTNLVTFSTTPDGGKSVSADFGLVCVGNTATVTVTNADEGVRYLLRNDYDNTPVGDTLTGVGDDLDLPIPLGYLVDPLTTFHVWAYDIASGCAGKLLDTVKIATQALSSPVFDIDQDFCSLDSGKVLLSATNTGYTSYLWSTDSTTTSITIQQSGVFGLTVTDLNGCRTTKSINVGEELLINGDFSLGRDTGYNSQYIWGPVGNGYPSNPQNNGYYTIATNAKNTHNDFWGKDHTSKTGNFMIINGDATNNKVWYETITVEANTRYYFSAWAMSLNDKIPFSIMRFKVNGVLVGDSAILPPGVSNNSNYGWRRFYGQWDSGPRDASNNQIEIEIVNLVKGNAGNDFGLDDISFSKLPPVKFFGASIGNGGNSLCVGASLSLTADLTGGQNPISYVWNGPNGFTSTAANPVIPAGTAVPGWYYLDAKEGRNCTSKDSVFIILGDPTASAVAQGIYKCQTGISIYVSGMVPNSLNNTISYTISTVAGTKVATGVDADASGVGAFYIANPPTTYDGKTLTVTAVANGSCSKPPLTTVSTLLIVKPNNNTWVGGATGNWFDAWNWCPGVPGSGTDITIPTGTTVYINENEVASVRDITLQGNAVVELKSNAVLNLHKNFNPVSTGKINALKGILVTRGDNVTQTLSGDYFVGKSISTLILFNTNTNRQVNLTGDTLKILSALEFANNAVDLFTNDKLVLVSSDTATARVGIIPTGTGNVITGNFIVERYLMNARKWRLLSVPTNRAGQTVRNSWQENGADGNVLKGYGFLAADPRYTALIPLGFDVKGNNSSVKKFSAITEAWDAVANTDALPMSDEQGYLVFVAGDRRISFPGSNTTKFRTVGTIYRGDLTVPVPASKFKVIGNPYASRIDLTKLIISAGIDNAVYVWDPSIGGAYGLGAFNTLFKSGSNYINQVASPIYGPQYSESNFIESGAAFLVKGNTGGNITFKETAKGKESLVANFAPLEKKWLTANLQLPAQGAVAAVQLDGVLADFDENYSNETEDNDIDKLVNTGESVGWKGIDRDIVVDRRFTPGDNDTLHLKISKLAVRNYQWEMILENMDYPGKQAFLLDAYKQTSTSLNMAGTTVVNFNIENIPGSYASDRFKIVFKQQAVLPVTITSIAANRNNDKTITIQWKVENEVNMQGYEVERSMNGRDFISLQTKAPQNNAGAAVQYNTIDADNLSGDLFYRIKANSLSRQVQYSAIVKVSGVKTNTSISVYPNPVIGKQMQVHFNSVETGNYRLSLMNTAGQVIYKAAVNVAAGSSAKTLQLAKDVAAGRYDLLITTPAGQQNYQQVIIQ